MYNVKFIMYTVWKSIHSRLNMHLNQRRVNNNMDHLLTEIIFVNLLSIEKRHQCNFTRPIIIVFINGSTQIIH